MQNVLLKEGSLANVSEEGIVFVNWKLHSRRYRHLHIPEGSLPK